MFLFQNYHGKNESEGRDAERPLSPPPPPPPHPFITFSLLHLFFFFFFSFPLYVGLFQRPRSMGRRVARVAGSWWNATVALQRTILGGARTNFQLHFRSNELSVGGRSSSGFSLLVSVWNASSGSTAAANWNVIGNSAAEVDHRADRQSLRSGQRGAHRMQGRRLPQAADLLEESAR